MSLLNNIITIQKYYKSYYIRKYIVIPSSYYQTKIWRKNRKWYKNGKSNECEKYQINLIEKILYCKLNKTNDRLKIDTFDIINKYNPMINDNGYEYTENFDSKLLYNNNILYFNFKFVCDVGGFQTRTLREVYYFIIYQLEYLLKNDKNNTYFINILDGDTCYNNMNKFLYLQNKEKYKKVINNIFIGDLHNFQKYYLKYIRL